MKRRDFLKSSSVAGAAAVSSWATGGALAQEVSPREFYELRTYEMQTGNRRAVLNEFLEKAFIPALNRLGSKPVGVFSVVSGSNGLNLFVLVPHASLESFLTAPAGLAADPEYPESRGAVSRQHHRRPCLHALRVDAVVGVQEPAQSAGPRRDGRQFAAHLRIAHLREPQ